MEPLRLQREEGSHVTTRDVQELYEYGRFANRKLLEAVSTLTPEEFTCTVGGSYGSIRTTMVHLLGAEWGWLARCGGPARGDRLKPEGYPTLQSVIALADKVEGFERDFLPTLSDADLTRVVEFSFVPGQMRSDGAAHADARTCPGEFRRVVLLCGRCRVAVRRNRNVMDEIMGARTIVLRTVEHLPRISVLEVL